MASQKAEVSDVAAFFRSLGDLHDVKIESFELDVASESLSFWTPDIEAALHLGEDSKIHVPSKLCFSGVSAVYIDVVFEEGVRISSVEVDGQKIKVQLNLGGGQHSWEIDRPSILFLFSSLNVELLTSGSG